MSEQIDPFETLRSIAAELLSFTEETDPVEYLETVEKAAYLITYIAEALEREFKNAAERGFEEKMKALQAIKVSDL